MTPTLQTPRTARLRLAEIIKFHRTERQLSILRVSRTVGAGTGTVEEWESGKSQPSPGQWRKLKASVARQLHTYNDHYQAAVAEAEAEIAERAMQTRQFTNHPHVTTNGTRIGINFGDKVLHAVATSESTPAPALPPPPSEPEDTVADETAPERRTIHDYRPNLPKDWKTPRAVSERRAFALNLMRTRPGIRGSGPDSLDEALVARFGVGISSKTFTELREEITMERARAQLLQEQGSTAPTPKASAKPTPKPDPADVKVNLKVAVELITSSIPNLKTFSITVDAAGAANLTYTLRETKVVETEVEGTLSLQVKR